MVRRDKPVYMGKERDDRRTPMRPFERKKTCPNCGWKGNMATQPRCDHCGYRWPVEIKTVSNPFKGMLGVQADPQVEARKRAAAKAASSEAKGEKDGQ
jgi:transcription elongation factor Elf1